MPESIDFNEVVIVTSPTLTVDMPIFQGFVESLHGEIVGLGDSIVAQASSYYETGNEALVSENRHTTLIPVAMAGEFKEAEANIPKVRDVLNQHIPHQGLEVHLTGEATFSRDYTEFTQKDLLTGEAIAMPLALIVLAIVFGALAAALLPMVMAIASIAISMGIVTIIGQVFEFHVFVQNMITMIGLAVGIDYSLFVLSRYREERARGLEKLEAIVAAGATASRARVFSGLTVVLALVGLLLVPHSVWISLGVGAILVVAVAMMASLTLLPAMLSLMGDGVDRIRVPFFSPRKDQRKKEQDGFWDRISRAVMRRPAVSLVIAGGLLLAAAVPLLDMDTGNFGVSTFPDESKAKEGYAVLNREFGFGVNDPVEIVIDGDPNSPAVQQAIQDFRDALATDEAFGPATLEVNNSGELALVSVPLVGDATGEESAIAAVTMSPVHSTAYQRRSSSLELQPRRLTSLTYPSNIDR